MCTLEWTANDKAPFASVSLVGGEKEGSGYNVGRVSGKTRGSIDEQSGAGETRTRENDERVYILDVP